MAGAPLLEALGTIGSLVACIAQRGNLPLQQHSVDGVIVDDQYEGALGSRFLHRRRLAPREHNVGNRLGCHLPLGRWQQFRIRNRQWQKQCDGCALTQLARDGDCAAHHRGEPLSDRKPEAGAAKHARDFLTALRKWLEERSATFARNADASVRHRKPHDISSIHALNQLRFDFDKPLGSEFDRVAHEIVENLLQPQRIHQHGRADARVAIGLQQERLTARVAGIDRDDALDQPGYRCDFRPDFELPGLDLRKVEDVVDDPQQRAPGILHDIERRSLLRVQVGKREQLEHAENAVHRRADLVAHHGEECRLRQVGALQLEVRFLELRGALVHAPLEILI